ncbi:MAG TPA: winged helix-turn-helix domain-containing protein, partial [Tahibacter sp.]|nr:winged helix-turn-helix domain-containing protein [Tahibacter sp.]
MHDGDIWELGDVVVDLATQRVRRPGGGETRLTPRAAAVLRALIRAGDRPLSREALLSEVWGEAEIGDEVLSKAINELRLALGDHDTRRRRFIETIPKRGYRLICGARALMSIPTEGDAATVTAVIASTDSVPIAATAPDGATAESADDGPAAAGNPGSNARLPPERPSPEQNTAPVPAGTQTSTASAAIPRASQSPAPPSPSRRRDGPA